MSVYKYTLENTEMAIKNGQSRDTKQKKNTIYVGHHFTQTHTNNVNKTCALLQTTEGKDQPNIVIMRKS